MLSLLQSITHSWRSAVHVAAALFLVGALVWAGAVQGMPLVHLVLGGLTFLGPMGLWQVDRQFLSVCHFWTTEQTED